MRVPVNGIHQDFLTGSNNQSTFLSVSSAVCFRVEMRPIGIFKSPSNPAHSENCPAHPGPLEVLFKEVQTVQSMAIEVHPVQVHAISGKICPTVKYLCTPYAYMSMRVYAWAYAYLGPFNIVKGHK